MATEDAAHYIYGSIGIAAIEPSEDAVHYLYGSTGIVPESRPDAAHYLYGNTRGPVVPTGAARGFRIWNGTEWVPIWACGMPLDCLGDVSKGTFAPSDPAEDDVWLDLSTDPPTWKIWQDDGYGSGEWVEFGGGGAGGGGAFCETVGDGVATSFDVAHALATDCVLVEAIEVASGDALVHGTDYTWLILDVDTIRIVFTVAPAVDGARVVVSAGGGGGAGAKDPELASRLIVPPDTTWYSNPDGFSITDPAKLHDGRWSGTSRYASVGNDTNPHLVVDLQTERVLDAIEWVMYTGNDRAYFGVSWATSTDGVTWDWLVFRDPAQPLQNYWGPHRVDARGRTARYVRYTAYGSTANAGNHLDQIMVYELVPQADIV